MIPSFEPVVSFYPLPKQSLVTVCKWFLFPWPQTLCGKKSFNWHVKSLSKECCQTYHFWADWDLLSLFKSACFFTNPIFIISPFAKFSHDLWYVSSIYYLHYIQIYLLVIRCYVSFKSYCFKASFLLSLLTIVSKTTSACLFFLNKALYVK